MSLRVGIERVAEERAADMFHMHPDLMSAPSVKVAEDESPPGRFGTMEDVVICDGRTARSFTWIEDSLHLSSYRVTSDVGKDRS